MAEEAGWKELADWAALGGNCLRGLDHAFEVFAALSKGEGKLVALNLELKDLETEIAGQQERLAQEKTGLETEIATLKKSRAATLESLRAAQDQIVQAAEDRVKSLQESITAAQQNHETWKTGKEAEVVQLNNAAETARQSLADARRKLALVKAGLPDLGEVS